MVAKPSAARCLDIHSCLAERHVADQPIPDQKLNLVLKLRCHQRCGLTGGGRAWFPASRHTRGQKRVTLLVHRPLKINAFLSPACNNMKISLITGTCSHKR